MYFETPPSYRPSGARPPAWVQWFVVLLNVTLVVGLISAGTWWYFTHVFHGGPGDVNAQPRVVTARGELSPMEKSIIELHKAASPSVVHITSMGLRRDGFSRNVYQVPEGTGSGFIWDDSGHVVTNYHVVRKASGAEVVLSDGSKWEAQLVGVAPEHDLAVLWIDAPKSKLTPLAIGTSHDLQVGQMVYAIGNPFGLDHSLTMGIISALGREIQSATDEPIKEVIQTDAAINPGNSGGPLLDSAGRLIGVNTAIYSPSGVSAGIGFAIPVDDVNSVVPDLIAKAGKMAQSRR
jgi:S1-C subfamily serine protease